MSFTVEDARHEVNMRLQSVLSWFSPAPAEGSETAAARAEVMQTEGTMRREDFDAMAHQLSLSGSFWEVRRDASGHVFVERKNCPCRVRLGKVAPVLNAWMDNNTPNTEEDSDTDSEHCAAHCEEDPTEEDDPCTMPPAPQDPDFRSYDVRLAYLECRRVPEAFFQGYDTHGHPLTEEQMREDIAYQPAVTKKDHLGALMMNMHVCGYSKLLLENSQGMGLEELLLDPMRHLSIVSLMLPHVELCSAFK